MADLDFSLTPTGAVIVLQPQDQSALVGSNAVLRARDAREAVLAGLVELVQGGVALIGRLPVFAALNQLTEEDLVRILTEPKNALVKQYQTLLSYDDVELEFDQDALVEIAKKAIERKTGARGLRSIIEETMMDVMFEVPSQDHIKKVRITKDAVEGKDKPLLETA